MNAQSSQAPAAVGPETGSGRASPFTRTGVLGIVVIGFVAFLAMLYFLSAGETGPDNSKNGRAHAESNGLNGYSALVDLIDADGFSVTKSRAQSNLATDDLLILTPPRYMDPEDLIRIIDDREYTGPTMVILPKWNSVMVNRLFQVKDPDKIKDGWVYLNGSSIPSWADEEAGPLALGLERGGVDGLPDEDISSNPMLELMLGPEAGQQGDGVAEAATKKAKEPKQRFSTLYPLPSISGTLPTGRGFYAKENVLHEPLVLDQNGRAIAISLEGVGYSSPFKDDEGDEMERTDPSNWVVFVIEPDIMNNWGLADEARAKAALSLVREMNYGGFDAVVFDLTLNGFGGAMNLLTLAFQPPFLAATLCLLLAMFIIGWRAFLRFGPAAVSAQGQAFGKAQLISNGADLIVRGKRLRLLAEPYIALNSRRLARSLGLPKPDPEMIDAALAQRRPGEISLTQAANNLRAATKPADILRAARVLNQQTEKT